MKIAIWFIAAVVSYLVAGVNPSILLSKLIYKEDIRTVGSKNPGFTNFKRVYGWKFAWLVLLIDVSKAILPCLVFGLAFGAVGVLDPMDYEVGSIFTGNNFQLGAAFAGIFAMFGHAYPIWYRFRGGKAFLVAATSVWFIDWRVGLICAGVFFFLLFTVQIMSISSMSAGVICPVAVALIPRACAHWAVLVCCIVAALLLIWRHKPNIIRLVQGKESKFKLFGKNMEQKTEGPKT